MIKLSRTITMLLVVLSFICMSTRPVSAHGTDITYSVGPQVQLQAKFDTGEPMANAQVTIYSPEDPANAWLVGEADAEGRFAFSPDVAMPGRWDIFVRTAGHGDSLYVEIDEAGAVVAGSSSGGLTVAQILLMSASVIWGMIGTALYFARGKSAKEAESIPPAQNAPRHEEPSLGESVS